MPPILNEHGPLINGVPRIGKEIPPSFSEFDRVVLRILLQEVARPQMEVAEIGSYVGNGSTKEIVNVLREQQGVAYCIDTWEGSENVPRHREFAAKYDLLETFFYNLRAIGGILCGHDCEGQPSDIPLDLRQIVASDPEIDAIAIDAFRFRALHPGTILAVHDCLCGDAKLWAYHPVALPSGERGLSSIWSMKLNAEA